MQAATGMIDVVQEGRFRLALPDGRSMLFVLSHDAALDPQDLPSLARNGLAVRVHFERGPHLDARIAHDVKMSI